MTSLDDASESASERAWSRELLSTIKMALKPARKDLFLVLTFGLLGRLFLLLNSIIIGKWIDSFSGSEDPSNLKYIGMLFGTTLLGLSLTLYFRVGVARVLTNAVGNIYDEVTWRTSRFPMHFFDLNPVGRIITRFSSDYMNVMRIFGGAVAEFITIAIDLFLIVILVSFTHVAFFPLLFLAGGANVWIYLQNRKGLLDQRKKTSRIRSPSVAHFAESLQGSTLIRVQNRTESFQNRFESLDRNYQREKIKSQNRMYLFSFQMNSLSLTLFLCISLLSYFLLQYQIATAGQIGAALTLILLSTNTIQIFFEWLSVIEEALVSFQRLNHLMILPLEEGAKLPPQSSFPTNHPKYAEQELNKNHPLPMNASVHVHDLWFRYRPENPWILSGIQFDVRPGEKVGLVGKTGSGKSTLIKALYHLYPIDRGVIRIDSHSPLETDLEYYRRHISLIPQDPVLFRGSLKDNLDPLQIHPEKKLLETLSDLGFFRPLDFQIHESGRNLSQGERQLVALGRCLLQQTPVVIFDEATSSIDPLTESILQRVMKNSLKEKTQIIIAHRLTTLEHCDRIFLLRSGRIEHVGPPREILPQIQAQDLS